jgi:chromosome segregation protein
MLLHIRWVQAKEAEGEAESQLNQATSLVAERANAQMQAAKDQAVASLKLPELRDNEAKLAAVLQRLQIARAQLEEDSARLLRRRDELGRRMAQLAEDIVREERMVADNAAVLDRLLVEEDEIRDILAEADERAEAARETMDEAAARLATSEAALAAVTAERAEAQAVRNQLEKAIRDLSERHLRLGQQLDAQARELADMDARIAALPDPEERRAAVQEAEQALEAAGEMLVAVEEALEEARFGEAALRGPVDTARARLAGIETEARTIRRMLEAGTSAGSSAPVVEDVAVDRGYETALGAALGDDLESPADVDAPVHWRASGDASADPALPGGVPSLISHVRAPAVLHRRLAQVGIAGGVEEALDLLPQLRPGQRLVTRDGAVFRWDGHVTGADAPSAAALRLEQKNRLAELEVELDDARAALADAEADLARAAETIRAEMQRQQAAREAQRVATRALAEAREALETAERASGDLIRRRAVLGETRAQIEGQVEEAAQALEDARAALEDAPDLSDLDLRLRAHTMDVATDRATLAEARAAHDGLAREMADRRRRLMAIAAERETWTTRATSAENHIATLREREAEAREEMEELAEAPDEIEEKRRELLTGLSNAEAARREAADALQEAENRQREADRVATTALSQLAESRETRGRAEERLVSARERRIEGETRIREALNCAPHEALRLTGHAAGAPLPDPRETERDLDRLRIERERLGAVNLRAEEEQRDLSEKLDALVTEREDIIEAIRKLRSAIQSLNREGRERLLAAFDVVNAQFQRLFTHLFGGGTAELQLIESEDPLDAGLEILARPPGKKPQTMTLLSGGEQALTAMALIFAVFLTNPAPICVLDEVDAPLDDHNVERYCNLMDEMAASTETRFIIITHNPITMARMNRLFGVTMAEQGVSQLVSVDLQTAEQLREAS